jgi:hypothetical protein
MPKSIYRESLKEAWKLVRKNTSLWMLGLLSALFAGSFGLSNFFSQLIAIMGSNAGSNGPLTLRFNWPELGVNGLASTVWMIWLIGLMLVLFGAVVYISVVAKTSLLIAVADFYKKKAEPKLAKIWNSGLKYFWRILAIEAIRKIALLMIVVLFGIIWYYFPFNKSVVNLIISITALILTATLGWVVSAVSIFTAGYTVIDNKSPLKALKKAWQLFHKHLLVSFELSVILTLIDLALIAIFAALVSYAFIPSVFIWIIAGAFSSPFIAILGTLVGLLIMILVIALFGAIYNTFYISVWMHMFMKMHHEGIFSRLIHHIGGYFKK